MANPKHLKILMQGVDVWNDWREKTHPSSIDLTQVNLGGADLIGINLENANLNGAFLSGMKIMRAKLNNAVFIGADLRDANLQGASLIGASIRRANLRGAYLVKTNFGSADMVDADLQQTDLTNARLEGANLSSADFTNANLDKADFSFAVLGETIFGNNDISTTIGLEDVRHRSFSIIDSNTLHRSKGKIPDLFLRGSGLSDWEIESQKLYNPDLSNDEINKILYKTYDLRAQQPIQISPLFISYSHDDSEFVNKLGLLLTELGVRFWRDIEHATAGRLEKQIDRAIIQNPTLLLVLSKSSLKSDWVQHEVRKARSIERETGHDVLCPVALDDSWKSSKWSQRIMEQVMEYNILDFSSWEDDIQFKKTFGKLIDGLNLYYKKIEE